MYTISALIGLLSWPGLARLVRGQILTLREQEFMQACEALGISDFSKIFKHLMPNVLNLVIVNATLTMASAILTEAGLSFLGMGVNLLLQLGEILWNWLVKPLYSKVIHGNGCLQVLCVY